MRVAPEICAAFSGLLTYPAGRSQRIVDEWVPLVQRTHPELSGEVAPLLAASSRMSEGELEELYARTFDNSADRALEVGWHLHGENYARGALMVRLKGMLRDHGLEPGAELPDHLANVLAVMGKARPQLAEALAEQVLCPALEKILAGFKDHENPYRHVLTALKSFLDQESKTLAENGDE